MDPDCPLCRLAAGFGGEVVTRLWRYEFGRVIVVTDLEPKGWAMRALAVPAVHVPCGGESEKTRYLIAWALDKARELIEAETGLRWVRRDLDRHSFSSHFHAQDCYEHAG